MPEEKQIKDDREKRPADRRTVARKKDDAVVVPKKKPEPGPKKVGKARDLPADHAREAARRLKELTEVDRKEAGDEDALIVKTDKIITDDKHVPLYDAVSSLIDDISSDTNDKPEAERVAPASAAEKRDVEDGFAQPVAAAEPDKKIHKKISKLKKYLAKAS